MLDTDRELVVGEEVREGLLDGAKPMSDRIDAYRASSAAALSAAKNPNAPPSLEIEEYAGCYVNDLFGQFELNAVGNGLASRFHGLDLTVEHLQDDVFLFSGDYTGDIQASFAVNESVVLTLTVPLGSPPRERIFTKTGVDCGATKSEG
jgi:hypothetical protein